MERDDSINPADALEEMLDQLPSVGYPLSDDCAERLGDWRDYLEGGELDVRISFDREALGPDHAED